MEVVMLNNDSRCRWLENKVMKGLYPRILENARDPQARKQYIIVDWISNDNGKVGVDLKWFKTLGVPAVQSYTDLPESGNFSVVNTGYDSIVHQEKILREKNVDIIDEPCPFVRRVRDYMENADPGFQYVYLCEPNHITMKNFEKIFPEDMILVQMNNYKEEIKSNFSGKPLRIIPYVTFLPKHVDEIMDYLRQEYPGHAHDAINAHCLWVKSKASPIVEINSLKDDEVDSFDAALLVSGTATANKSLLSLYETCEDRNIQVVSIHSLADFRRYEKENPTHKVLLVRSPIPNNTETLIMAYINGGRFGVLRSRIFDNRVLKGVLIGAYTRIAYAVNKMKLAFRNNKEAASSTANSVS